MSADSAEDSEVSSLFEVKVARKLVLREPCISCLLLTNLLLYFRNYADTRQLHENDRVKTSDNGDKVVSNTTHPDRVV